MYSMTETVTDSFQSQIKLGLHKLRKTDKCRKKRKVVASLKTNQESLLPPSSRLPLKEPGLRVLIILVDKKTALKTIRFLRLLHAPFT